MLFICAVVALVGPLVADGNPTVDAIVNRVSSLLALNTDVSAQARLDLLRTIIPDAIASPFGHGIGQAGVATKLGGP